MLINCHIGLLYNTELVKLFRFKSNHHLLEIVAHYRIALRIDFVLRSLTLINWESFQFDFVNKNLFYCVRMWIFNKNGMDLQIELNKQKKLRHKPIDFSVAIVESSLHPKLIFECGNVWISNELLSSRDSLGMTTVKQILSIIVRLTISIVRRPNVVSTHCQPVSFTTISLPFGSQTLHRAG